MKAERPYGYEDHFSEKYFLNKGFKQIKKFENSKTFYDLRKNNNLEFGFGVFYFYPEGGFDNEAYMSGDKQKGDWYWRFPLCELQTFKTLDNDMQMISDGLKYIERYSSEYSIRRKVRVLLPIFNKIKEAFK